MKKWFTRFSLATLLLASTNTMSAQQTLTVDGSKGYDWVDGDGLVQGTDYIIPGTDETWYAMPDFFTHKVGNVWTFNAYSTPDYAYWITLDQNLKSINVTYRVDGKDPEGKYADWNTDTYSLWMGGVGFGFPTFTSNPHAWAASDVALPQIAGKVFRIQFVIGEQLNPDNVNFKFFTSHDYGNDGEMLQWIRMEQNEWIYLNGQDNEASGDLANCFLQPGAAFANGDTLTITIDMNAIPGTATVTYQAKKVADFPTFCGSDMTKKGNNWIYETNLTQGQELAFDNLAAAGEGMDIATAYVNESFATSLGGGKFRFNAIDGAYTVALYPSLNYIKITPGTYAEPTAWDDDCQTGAIWIVGNSSIGLPSYTSNQSNWGPNATNSIPLAEVAPNVFKITLTAGKEIATSGANFKFFKTAASWGDFIPETIENDYFYVNDPEAADNAGNVLPTGEFTAGDRFILTVDASQTPARFSVESMVVDLGAATFGGAEMAKQGSAFVYEGALEQGKTYAVTGSGEVASILSAPDFFYNYDYFTKQTDGTYLFNAVSGRYNVTLDLAKKYFRVYPIQEDGSAGIFTEAGGWATWACGDAGLGFPSAAVNRNYWGGDYGWAQNLGISISPAQVQPKVYRLTLTVGKQVAAGAEFKFYDAYNYNYEGGPLGDGLNHTSLITTESDIVAIPTGSTIDEQGNEVPSTGNLKLSDSLSEGETYVLILDRNAEVATLKVEKASDETGAGVELPSAIQDVTTKTDSSNKAIYNLQGVRVAHLKKGLYIQNGHKFVVK